LLDLFILGWFCCFGSVYFIIDDLVYIISLSGRSVIVTFLFDWTSLLFMAFVFIIYFLVILYEDDCMFGDLNIIRFVLFVLIHETAGSNRLGTWHLRGQHINRMI
jgi:hypothetical protein